MSEKIELKDILGAIDLNAKCLWDELTEEQRKSIPFFILNRFMSSAKSNKRQIQEHFVLTVNEFYNKNYFSTHKHPKLQWLLLCSCAHETGNVFYHEYIKTEKGKNSKLKLLEALHPDHKITDLETLAQINSLKAIIELAKDHGWDDEKLKKYL